MKNIMNHPEKCSNFVKHNLFIWKWHWRYLSWLHDQICKWNELESFPDLFLEIENTEVKDIGCENRKDVKLIILITFIYCSVMDFTENKLEIKNFVPKMFLTA